MADFDPDAYLAKTAPAAPPAFDPDAYLRATQPAPAEATPAPSTGIPGPRRGTTPVGIARGVASLADVTLGGAFPGAVQFGAYPFLRAAGKTPEEAKAAAESMAGKFAQPFGKAFGVVGTPEYEQETSRQLMNYIGENFQKGAKWISDRTGLPAADVENMMATLTLTTPKVVPAAVKGVKTAAQPFVEQTAAGLEMAAKPLLEQRRARLSAESYAKGPQLDAATDAQRLGIALNPVDIQPSMGTRAWAGVAGERGQQAINAANRTRVREVTLGDLRLPPDTQLTSRAPFEAARTQLAEPYNKVRAIERVLPDDNVRRGLDALRPDETLIGGATTAKQVNKLIDDAIAKVDAGMNGEQLLNNIRNLRANAKKIYGNNNATPKQLAVADSTLAIATQLESLIDSSIFNPRLLQEFRAARQQMARTYAYEAATDFNTGSVDVGKLARITAKDNALTGDIASLGRIAGNFPDAFNPTVASKWETLARLGRTGAAGTTGGLLGYALGGDYAGAAIGSVLGAGLGEVGQRAAARRIASPEYQAGLRIPDYRLPPNQLAAQMAPPTPTAPVPYDWRNAMLPPEERPNWVFGQPSPDIQAGIPPGPPRLPMPTAESTLAALRAEDVRRAGMSRAMGQEAEARQVAAEAMARQPTRGEVILDYDPFTGRLRETSRGGIKGATPETFVNYGANLESAVQKLSGRMVFRPKSKFERVEVGTDAQGAPIYEMRQIAPTLTPAEFKEFALPKRESQAFAMTAEEKIAWNKAKNDLAEVMPGMKTLTDEAIANKIADRQWTQTAVANARAKSEQLARQEALLTEQLANRENLRLLARDITAKQKELAKVRADRERLMTLAEQMDDLMRAERPAPTGRQGPKTREFLRNRLLGGENTNNLAR